MMVLTKPRMGHLDSSLEAESEGFLRTWLLTDIHIAGPDELARTNKPAVVTLSNR
jgi:hypothetical protein